MKRVVLLSLIVGAVLVAAFDGSAGAPADVVAPVPYAITSASFFQQGQEIVWQIAVAHGFTAAELAEAQRSLCLDLQRVRTRASIGELCVKPRHGLISLVFIPSAAGAGAPRSIAATITRASAEQLTATFLPSSVDLEYGASVRWQALSELAQTTCGQSSAGVVCPPLITSKAGVAKLHVPVLVGCVASGPSVVSQGPTNVHQIALTFDDGPWPDPPASTFIQLLARYRVPATFFEIGRQIPMFDASGAAQRAMIANGDMIGDHTWTHPMMTALSPAAQTAEIQQTAEVIRKDTGFTPCLWRPPYGDINASLVSLARSLGFLTIMWDVDPRDWALPGVGAIYSNVISNAHNGAIVIQHFGGGPRYETIAALPHEITALRARGYEFVTVAQMLGLRLVYK